MRERFLWQGTFIPRRFSPYVRLGAKGAGQYNQGKASYSPQALNRGPLWPQRLPPVSVLMIHLQPVQP